MSRIKPFRGYRPRPDLAGRIASFPYDVINSEEARALAAGNPYSFLHVGKPEIDLDPGINLYDDRVYAQGVANLRRMIAEGTLRQDEAPRFYVYAQKMGNHLQKGLVVLCRVDEYEKDLIRKHEFTRKDKEDDRTRHVTECNANAEPVFLTYRAERQIDAIVETVAARPPAHDLVSEDGIGHTVWVIDSTPEIEALTAAFARVPALYVADGHHRTAAAVRHGQMMRGRQSGGTGDEPFEWFMAVVFPHDQLQIMDYNRVVKDLNGMTPAGFLEQVKQRFSLAPAAAPKPPAPRHFGMFLEGAWQMLTPRTGTYPADHPVKGLDVSILQDNLLAPVLGIADPRTDKRIDFVGGIRGTGELEKRVREGCAAAFSLFPTSLAQLMAVADSGSVMPPKSTWFEPKLRSGLVVRLIED